MTSHIFLHPSETGSDGNQEGVPNSMLEAWRLAFLFSPPPMEEFPKQLKTTASGILVNERDHRALADALIDCAKDPARLTAMGHAASENVAKCLARRSKLACSKRFICARSALSRQLVIPSEVEGSLNRWLEILRLASQE